MPAGPKIRLATFNVENLYSRPTFWDPQRLDDQRIGNVFFEDPTEAKVARRIFEATLSDEKCQLTALALMAANADIVAIAEVDNLNALKMFRDQYLGRASGNALATLMKAFVHRTPRPSVQETIDYRSAEFERIAYRHFAVLEGNDRRGIDVGVLARPAWRAIKGHADASFADLAVWPAGIETYNDGDPKNPRPIMKTDRIFKRDCLEVEFEIGGAPLTVFICHFKSMNGSRIGTRVMREAEMLAVRAIVTRRFGADTAKANWAICGDFNDYYEIDGDRDIRDLRTGEDSPSAIPVLLDGGFAVDIMQRRPPLDRWTTYHSADDAYAQLDYILLSPALAAANPTVMPEVIRIGLPYRADRYSGKRLERIGWDRPKASDHCPVVVELTLPMRMT